jgi:hypothetical protein
MSKSSFTSSISHYVFTLFQCSSFFKKNNTARQLKRHLVQSILKFWALIRAPLVECSPPFYPMMDAGSWEKFVIIFRVPKTLDRKQRPN